MGKLVIEHLVKQFDDVTAVDHVSFTVEDGEFLTVVGPSGCGKTTLLRMIAGFAEPTHGSIRVDGDVFYDFDKNIKSVPPEERGIGMVFQTYAVWPHMNVFNNVAYPLKIRKLPRKEIRAKVDEVLKLVHLEDMDRRMAFEMSGGQQQRVALARALVMEPRLLLLDEPFSNLDAVLREQMQTEVKEIQRKLGITVINVTHDQSEAMAMSDKIALMRDGRLIQFDTPKNIYEHPVNTFAAGFIGSANVLPLSVLPEEKDYADGYIAFRAHNVRYDETSTFAAKVLGSEYLGNGIRYRLETEGGHVIRMLAPETVHYEIGEMVPITIRDGVRLQK